jgi:hypothetical protein
VKQRKGSFDSRNGKIVNKLGRENKVMRKCDEPNETKER